GYTPEAIREFCERIGVAKANSTVEHELLEYCVRSDLNHRAPRVMCVAEPILVIVDNYPVDAEEVFDAPLWPHDVPRDGTRELPFSRELYIEAADFQEEPEAGFYRLAPGREVRLRHAYVIRCERVIKDAATGQVVALHCTYDPATRGGATPDGRKVPGTIHWVS